MLYIYYGTCLFPLTTVVAYDRSVKQRHIAHLVKYAHGLVFFFFMLLYHTTSSYGSKVIYLDTFFSDCVISIHDCYNISEYKTTWIDTGMGSANERRRYNVKSSLIDSALNQNDPKNIFRWGHVSMDA